MRGAATATKAVKSTRLTLMLVVAIGLPLLPLALVRDVTFWNATGTWALAAIAAMLGTMMVAPRVGLRIAVILGVLSVFGYSVSHVPWAAGLVMALGAGLYGLSERHGATAAVGLAPIALVFTIADPQQVLHTTETLPNALMTGGLALVGALWGTIVGIQFGKKLPKAPAKHESITRTRAFALTMAVVTGLAMALVSHQHWNHSGAWFVMTLFIVLQPRMHDAMVKALHRGLGTVLGFAIAYVIALVVKPEWALYLITFGLAVTMVSIKLDPSKPYWLYATFVTPMVVLLEGTGSNIAQLDVYRLAATLGGVATALLVLLALQPIGRHLDARIKADEERDRAAAAAAPS